MRTEPNLRVARVGSGMGALAVQPFSGLLPEQIHLFPIQVGLRFLEEGQQKFS